jgi:hypothetical protein
VEFLWVALAVGIGAFIKSITGMGLPPIAIPVLAVLVGPYDAIVIMTLSTLVTNGYLVWAYRDAAPDARNLRAMVWAGVAGTPIGVFLLTSLSPAAVGLGLGILVLTYVGVALWKPRMSVTPAVATRIAVPVGLAGGVLQGATGLSAVILASYIHAMGVGQRAFVFMIATLFGAFAAIQAVGFVVAGAYSREIVMASVLATAIALIVLAAGTRLSPRISPVMFHRLVLAVLALSATKLIYDALV